ncbi:MAG: hypothetical protein OXG24_04660 [Gammaproteobacteria bacterium]|nr:hypothetical protein [Gammaproteobacteria bacterium]
MRKPKVHEVRGEFQKIVESLMRTLLEEHPTLLDKKEIASLMDAEHCKNVLGLNLLNFALLRHRNQGRMIQGRGRYWKHVYADEFLVCSQWWKKHHQTNALALSRFVSALARRRSEHAGSRTLLRFVEVFDHYVAGGKADLASVPAKPTSQVRPSRRKGPDWPDWPRPNDEDLRELAGAMTPFVRFLDPGIVYAVVEDNRHMWTDWSSRLEALGIDPAIYLWEGSPCVFPGVRRHAGSAEIAVFKQQAAADEVPPQCLVLDDNDYPKHLWAFACTGKPFRNRGPEGYHLAHLIDHKEYRNRWREELDNMPDAKEPVLPYGLFTSAANLAYVPSAFLRPTDFSSRLRSLMQRRAQQLYGRICRIVPPPMAVKPCDDRNWSLDNFRWSTPVGGKDNIPDFLDFRRKRQEELFDERHAVLQGAERNP